jgi:hypothetical protein
MVDLIPSRIPIAEVQRPNTLYPGVSASRSPKDLVRNWEWFTSIFRVAINVKNIPGHWDCVDGNLPRQDNVRPFFRSSVVKVSLETCQESIPSRRWNDVHIVDGNIGRSIAGRDCPRQ